MKFNGIVGSLNLSVCDRGVNKVVIFESSFWFV